jgi:GH25 family lysozyme M1 (1,4-beta-N-acetylmuramidase)
MRFVRLGGTALLVLALLGFGFVPHASAAISAQVWDTGGIGLTVRSAASSASDPLTVLDEGTTVQIDCQVFGEQVDGNNVWDYLPEYGGYAADRYLYTGYDGRHPDLPLCDDGGTSYPEGFDNSNNNEGTIDFGAAGEQFDFAILKASESTDFVDAYFAERFAAAQGNLIVGAYHFFDPRADGVAQAEHHLQILADAGYQVSDADTLPVMVDVEPNYVEPDVGFCFDVDAATMNARLTDYIRHITEQTGQGPLVYTNGEMVRDCGLDTTPLLDLPLVAPAWEQWGPPGNDPQATAESLGWDTWTFWQYDSYITLPGGVGALADRFNGDRDELAALAGS